MNEPVKIDPEFQSLIPSLSPEEFNQLEENCKRDGILDSLKVWNGILIDGHNRYRIAEEWDLNYQTEEMDFPNRTAVIRWIAKNQLGRRNIDKWQRFDLNKILEKTERNRAKERMSNGAKGTPILAEDKGDTRDKMAERIGVSHGTYDKMKTIDDSDDEELKQQVRSGEVSINQAYKAVKGITQPSPQKEMKKFKQEVKDRREEFKEEKESGVIDFQRIKQEQEDRQIVIDDLWLQLMKMGKNIDVIFIKHNEGEINIKELAKHANADDYQSLSDAIIRWRQELMEIFEVMEEVKS